MKEIGPIDKEEIKVVTFPFVGELDGATISTAVVTSRVVEGTDPDAASMVQGAAVISTTDVKQRIKGMVPGASYELRAKVADNLGLVHVIKVKVTVEAD